MARPVPASCVHLTLEAVGRELIRSAGNVKLAAKALGVPIHDLRLLTYAQPSLIDAAYEAEEQALDEAEAVVLEAMRGSGNMPRRIRAASFYLRATAAGGRRGFV